MRGIRGAVTTAIIVAFLGLQLMPGVPSPGPNGSDKVGHFALWGALVGALAWGRNLRDHLPEALLALTLLAAAIEGAQALIPGRSLDVADMAADLGGALAGLATCARRHPHATGDTGSASQAPPALPR